MEIKSLFVKISADVSELSKALNESKSKLAETGKALQSIGKTLSAAVTIPLAAVGTAAIKMAMDATESENLFEVSMGGMADAARAWSEELRNQLGLNAYEVRKNVGVFYTMFDAMGLGKEKSYELSTGLTKLAYDMASFYNIKPEEAFDKLKAGMTGVTEPLKRLGILVDDNSVKTYAYTHGIAQMGSELTEQQKVMARYGLILEQTKNAQGDLARTIDSPTNKLRVMSSQIQQTAIDLGMALMPAFQSLLSVVQKGVKILNEIVGVFRSLPGPIQTIIIALAGLAAAAGPVMIFVGQFLKMLPAIITGVKLLIGVINPLTIAIGAAAAAGIGFYTVLTQLKEQKEENKKIDERFQETTERLKSKLWEAAQQAGLTAEQFQALTEKYNGNIAAMARAIYKGQEGKELQQALAEVGRKHAEAIDKQREAQEKATQSTTQSIEEMKKAQEQLEKIANLRKQLTDEIQRATLTDYEYQKWALNQGYAERVANIQKEITDEQQKNQLLILARQSYLAQLEELETSHQEKQRKAREEFIAEIVGQEYEMYNKRVQAQQTYLASRQEVTNALMALDMSELQLKLFNLEQEKQKKLEAINQEKLLNQTQKDELIALWTDYYDRKRALIEQESSDWWQFVSFTQQTLEKTLTGALDAFFAEFQEWGKKGGSILKAFGAAFKSMSELAISALRDLVAETLKSAIKTIAAKKAEAIASQIANVMKSIPFPLNLALVAGAIAAVSKLFAAIKLAEGGIVTKPTLAVVGEAGPEAVIPLNRYPAFALAGAGGPSINLSVNIYGDINNAGGIDEISERMATKLQFMLRGAR